MGFFNMPITAFAPFYDTRVDFIGTRRDSRTVAVSIDCMVTEDGMQTETDLPAPSNSRIFNVSFPVESWSDETKPQIGEWVCFKWGGEEIAAKISSIPQRSAEGGDFIISAVWNPDGRDRPQW